MVIQGLSQTISYGGNKKSLLTHFQPMIHSSSVETEIGEISRKE